MFSLIGLLALGGCGGQEGVKVERFSVKSRLVERTLEQVTITPPGGSQGRPLLVLLHGRDGQPDMFLYPELLDGLERLGDRAPAVLLVNGGRASYFHDRRDGRWGSYVLHEAIPAAAKLLGADATRVAIGGISMGGWGALSLARESRGRFCGVGAHSAAMWFDGADTPVGAFDDAEDFERHDLIEAASGTRRPFGRTKVWIDVGEDDSFAVADRALANLLRANGQPVSFRLGAGRHEMAYWRANTAAYLRFYANALATCRR